MSEKSELSAALKLEIVDQLSREELVKIVLTQQKLIEKLQQKLEKLQERQPSNSKTSSKHHRAIWYRNPRQPKLTIQKSQSQSQSPNQSENQEDSLDISAKPAKDLGE